MKKSAYAFAFLGLTVIAAALLVSTLPSSCYAQRIRGVPHVPSRMFRIPPNHEKVFVGGRPYFYHNGYFYRGWGGRYTLFYPPIGARLRFLPYGFWSFYVGPNLYYYGGGAYFQYYPDQRIYVVVPKPNDAPAAPSGNEDVMNLTDGSTLTGVFVGATPDTIRFQVKDDIKNIPITQVKSVTFAPSTFKEQK